MITQGEFSRYFKNSSPVLLKEKYGDMIGEFGKGLRRTSPMADISLGKDCK